MTVADVEKRFKELDRDRDGKVSAAELARDAQFQRIDSDHDGFISIDEARTHFTNLRLKSSERIESQELTSNSTLGNFSRQHLQVAKPTEYSVGRIIPVSTLRDIDGVDLCLSEFKSYSATIIAVTSTSCPLSKRFLPKLARIEEAYLKSVRFIFVNPISSDSDESILAAIRTNALKGPYVRDPDGTLLTALRAMSTTDCFVIDSALTLRYRGAVDDQYGVGYAREQPRQTMLVDALESVLSGQSPL